MPGAFEFPNEELTKKYERGADWPPFTFEEHLLFGYFFKNIAIILFEKAGYDVYPYGYETTIPSIKRRIYQAMSQDVDRRIRSTPDLLVGDPEKNQLTLAEVKARSLDYEQVEGVGAIPVVKMDEVALYRQFWPEAIVLLFCPDGNRVYAAQVSEINIVHDFLGCPPWHNAEELFPRLGTLKEDFRRTIARKIAVLFQVRREGQI